MIKRVSDIKKMEKCEKLLWLSKKMPQPFSPYLYYNMDIYDLALEKLGVKRYYEGRKGDNNDVFFEKQKEYYAFTKVRFMYEDLRIHIPLMIRRRNKYNVYFLYASCFPKESEAINIADHLWVLEKLNIPIRKVEIIHLNASYVRKEQLDVEEMIVVDDCLYNDKNRKGDSVASLLAKNKRDLTSILNEMDHVLSLDHIEKQRSNVCTRRNKCPYFDVCFSTPNKDTSILNLVSCSKKFALLEKGIEDISQIDFEMIEGTRHQFAQVLAAKTNQLVFDTYGVESFFKDVTYPISYLDFEWETYVYPPFKEMKPFDVLTFQYSLHIEKEDGSLTHHEYLGRKDCRVEFIEHLLNDIPKEGSILCFNVEGAEKLRLKQLAKQFPEYEEALKQIWTRMIDLSIPFSTGLIYDNRMAGMYSLKKLVSIFTDYSYEDLDISHGIEAVRNYRHMENEEEENQETIKELLEYCSMDTYAEYLIYHFILDKIKSNKEASRL